MSSLGNLSLEVLHRQGPHPEDPSYVNMSSLGNLSLEVFLRQGPHPEDPSSAMCNHSFKAQRIFRQVALVS